MTTKIVGIVKGFQFINRISSKFLKFYPKAMGRLLQNYALLLCIYSIVLPIHGIGSI